MLHLQLINLIKTIFRLSCLVIFVFNISVLNAQILEKKISGYAQGTTYHIIYFDSLNRDFGKEIEDLLLRFDASVSTYNPNSIISKVNSNQKRVVLDSFFIICFNKAKEIYKLTDGAFDPTVFSLVNAWGFGPGEKQHIDQNKIDSLLQFTGFNLIELKDGEIYKKDPRVALDFNAFAQGYSVDVISEFLNKQAIKSYLVEIGGEVYAKGIKSNGEQWRVGIELPNDNKEAANPIKAIAKIDNMALSTSGNYRKFFIENGIKYAHHIDPKNGYPTKNNLLSASVFADKCITTDAMATGLLVMGLDKAIDFLEAHGELQAYLIYSDEKGIFKVYQTKGLAAIISDAD